MSRPSVLHVVVTDAFAGVERHVARLARAQADAGHPVMVIGGDPAAMRAAMRDPSGTGDVPVVAAGPLTRVVRLIRSLGRRADVVHVHMTAAELAAGFARVIPLSSTGAVVSTRHFGRPRGHGPQARVVGMLAERAIRAQIAVSRFVAEQVESPTVVVHPGVDRRSDSRPASERDKIVLLAQRLELEKRGDFALRTFAHSGLAHRGWRLRIAGDGSQRPALERLVAELGLAGAVDFLGMRHDVPELMSDAAILLAPCDVEALGLTVLEGMSGGLPTIAAGAGGHLELLDGLDPRALHRPDDWTDAATKLADLAGDPTGRDRFGAAQQARQRMSFTLDAQVESTYAIYQEVL